MKYTDSIVKLFEFCRCNTSLSQLHNRIFKYGLAHKSFYASKLITLYGKHVSVDDARKLFDETPKRTVYLYNITLRSYCKEKRYEDTLLMFNNMVSKPDCFTVPIVLKACGALHAFKYGEMVHGYVLKNKHIASDVFVGSALVQFYSKCGKMGCGLKVFEEFSCPDVCLWTSVVTGYEQNGFAEEAVEFFRRMVVLENSGVEDVTLVSLVSACVQLGSVKLGRCVHGFVIRRGLICRLSLVNSLLNLYGKTRFVRYAVSLFREMQEKDVVSWSSMVGCYVQNGDACEAIKVFNEMIEKNFEPNEVTVVTALQACAARCDLDEGRKIHDLAISKGFELNVSVSSALIDMYMKCLSPADASDVFSRTPKKDVVCWVAFLSGFALNEMPHKSIEVFRNMLAKEIQPDAVAMVKILTSCAESGILQQALTLHCYVIKKGFNSNIFVAASLIESYSKCGSIENAVKIFAGVINKDIVIYSAMIAAYGIHGKGEQALEVFEHMLNVSALKPNNVTFLSILSACSHAGLVKKGTEIFNTMLAHHQQELTSEHYAIMVDLLGRNGQIDKALNIINNMPIPAGPDVWGALLGACRIHHDTQIGELAAKNLLSLDPNHAGYYILLSNIYAQDEKWSNVAKLRALVKKMGLKRKFGESVIEVQSEVHKFVADDRLHHPEYKHVYRLLRQMQVKMREDEGIPL